MIYLDNAATTNHKPQQVIDAVVECLTKYSFNPNRGGSKQSVELQQKLYETRRNISLLVNNDSEQRVVFTSGCTHALNLGIIGTAKRGHIIITATEHNSVLRCAMQLQKKGFVEISIAQPDENGEITVNEIEKYVRKDTYMLCVSHASNVTGKAQKLYELGRFARQNNILFLVDCAQSVGYFPIDMAKCYVDMIAFGAHKGLHAMQGAGALVFNKRVTPRPIIFGGTGTESENYYQPSSLPDGLESGTLPTPAILAMNAGISWWAKNWQSNRKKIEETHQIILKGLSQISDVQIYSKSNRSGIIAFNIGKRDSNEVADILSQKNDIVVRGGLHCAPLMHKYLGTFKQGIVRASVSCVTSLQECYALLNAVEYIAKRNY